MQKQIDQLYKPLFLFVKKRISIQEDAEDITQDVFLKLSKSDIDNIENLKSWLYSIAKNTIIDFYRKKKVQTKEIDDAIYFEDNKDEKTVEELSQCISLFIDELPKEYNLVMRLSDLEEIPQKEIAEKLDMNYVTVRSKIQRGRKKLKNLFSECCTISQGTTGSILDYNRNKGCNGDKDCSEEGDC